MYHKVKICKYLLNIGMYLPHSTLLWWNQKESMIKTMIDLFLRIIPPNSIPANSKWVPREGLTQTQSNCTVTSDLGHETVVACSSMKYISGQFGV